jgi:hypothetical protein
LGAISHFAIALRLVQLPGFNATDTTDSDHPKVPWLLGSNQLGRAPFWQSIHTARPIRGEGRFFFFFFFGFSSIRDTVLLSPPRSFKHQLLLPDKRTHDHYQQQRHQPVTPTVPTNQTNFLTAFLRTEQSILDFPRRHLSHPATRRSLLFAREPSLRRQTFHLDRRDSRTSNKQAFSSSTPLVFDDHCVVNRSSTHTGIPSTVVSHQICFPESTQPGRSILERQPTFQPQTNLAEQI